MFRFANSEYLYLLLLIPVFTGIFLFAVYAQKKAFERFAGIAFWNVLSPDMAPARRNLKFVLFLLVVICILVALARPQFGSRLEEVKREGIEMIIALDVSKSMLAEDIKPNRLTRARQAISAMINTMQDDKIGMIVFAGEAYIQLPITSDYVSAKLFLDNISTSIVSKQGTAIGSAIELGLRSFTQDTQADKVLVIISDGENHEGDAMSAAREAAEKGIRIYTIGMASREGSLIPVYEGGRRQGFLKDRQGEVVMSRLNARMLEEIAEVTGGSFYPASTGSVGLNKLYNELNKLQKSEITTQQYSEYNDQFHYLLGIALLLLLIDQFILERKSRFLSRIKVFE